MGPAQPPPRSSPSLYPGSIFELQTLRSRAKEMEADIIAAKRDHDKDLQEQADKEVKMHESFKAARGKLCTENKTLQLKLNQEIQAHETLRTGYNELSAEYDGLKSRVAELDGLNARLSGVNLDDVLAFHTRWSSIDLDALVKVQQERLDDVSAQSRGTKSAMSVDSPEPFAPHTCGEDDLEREHTHKAFVLSVSNLTHVIASRIPPVSNPSHSDLLFLTRKICDSLNIMIAEDFARSERGFSSFCVRGDGGIDERVHEESPLRAGKRRRVE